MAKPLEGAAEIYAAVVLGTHDYVRKQGFKKVVIGLSGGVDSALTAAIAADALGPENVIGVRMPSRHTSPESLEDAGLVAEALGIQLLDFPIEPRASRLRGDPRRRASAAPSRASPRRTSSRASAAPSCTRCRTSSATSC